MSSNTLPIRASKRYYELDWLRVILILAVFLHHVFMPFNGDDWHITNTDSSKLLDDIMVYFEQIRLPVLFFIAGAGSYLLLQRASVWAFLKNKLLRLVVPFFVGMMLIVPPQEYFEHPEQYDGLMDAYRQRLLAFEPNHLWFLEFLIVFMCIAIPVNAWLRSAMGGAFTMWIARIARFRLGLFALVLFIIAIRCWLKATTVNEGHGIDNLALSAFYGLFFLSGLLFMSSPNLWQSLALHRRTSATAMAVCSCLFYAYYLIDFSNYASLEVRWALWWVMCSLVSWSAMLTLTGYASAYCTSSPAWLRTANSLIFPFYILHQTVIVALAYYIVQWPTTISVKSITLLVVSSAICAASCYVIIRPFTLTRRLFGMKPLPPAQH
ncbi:acyltransferase [Aestuariibacter sp. GS-14]|uniref:acyltransferase family protein n=1 Tax=Aestuariibacter sp. GS-14 TaxID=2590670 RepID=UPI0011269FFE|nr:acyltransferase family protein [Aestuariibacter sp. GS-14]TPV56032.1 acyltransferase [Aestuariibacter sp. GS-14]